MTSSLSLLHFNDAYRATPQKISSNPLETIDVTQFTALLHDLRDQWTLRDDGNRDGLVLFSGDVFSPSIESSVTRGSHMVIFRYTVLHSDHGFDNDVKIGASDEPDWRGCITHRSVVQVSKRDGY